MRSGLSCNVFLLKLVWKKCPLSSVVCARIPTCARSLPRPEQQREGCWYRKAGVEPTVFTSRSWQAAQQRLGRPKGGWTDGGRAREPRASCAPLEEKGLMQPACCAHNTTISPARLAGATTSLRASAGAGSFLAASAKVCPAGERDGSPACQGPFPAGSLRGLVQHGGALCCG
ncbi:ryanodine receptor 1 [Platysternon megacephalum]|uniref:Ryanodine receptor 1 n=1 Tax=Platysternon megacephalum TaxID=55544 RepID=A0A4D9DG68_9SAUR|nr:ryanodine receptor 1 [Platysternon megacephalum]